LENLEDSSQISLRQVNIVKSMVCPIRNIVRLVKGKDSRRIKDRAKKIVEKDRLLQNRLARAS